MAGRLPPKKPCFFSRCDRDKPREQKAEKQTKGNRLAFQGDRHFTYDSRGNLIKEARGKNGKLVTSFTYNAQNQLIEVNNNGTKTQYHYDALGRRTKKISDEQETQFLWNGDVLLSETQRLKTVETDKSTNTEKTTTAKIYVFEPNSFKPLAQIQNNEIYHYHLDHLGTPQELTANDGSIVWSAHYKTYGNLALKEVDDVENNLRFQGQYFDEESGLHYNRHRYYNPNTGTFITQDPIGLLGGLNNYQYAPNPVGWIDPFGLTTCKELDSQPDTAPNKKDANGRWHNKKGHYTTQSWPPNEGFGSINGVVQRETVTLTPGQTLDRYGGWTDESSFRDKGSYFSDVGVPFENRALPPETLSSPYNQYEVIEAFDVEAGPIAPWFGQPGGGTQYLVPRSEGGVEGLIKSGKIKRTTGN